MHEACSKAVFLNWHLNAQTMQQLCGRLIRIGQKGYVIIHLIKLKDSYHDHIERMLMNKWMINAAVEMDLPPFLSNELLEIVIMEVLRRNWESPVNRYAWRIMHEIHGTSVEFHSKTTKVLGHIFSLIARVVLFCDDEERQFWDENQAHIVSAAETVTDAYQSEEQVLKLFDLEPKELANQLKKKFEKIMRDTKKQKNAAKAAKQAAIDEKRHQRVLARQAKKNSNISPEMVSQEDLDNDVQEKAAAADDDSDDGSDDEDDEEDEDEDEGGDKEKGGDKDNTSSTKRPAPEGDTPQAKRRRLFTITEDSDVEMGEDEETDDDEAEN